MNTPVLNRIGGAMRQPVDGTQAAFRALLDAFASPGRVVALPRLSMDGIQPPTGGDGRPLDLGLTALLLTLLDRETTVRLHGTLGSDDALAYLRFHTGVRAASQPSFEVLTARALDAACCAGFELGSDEAPQHGATVIVLVDAFDRDDAPCLHLQGPGIADTQTLQVAGVSRDVWAWRQARQADYPRGLEMVFVCDHRIAALPRSTRVQEIG